MSESVAGRYRAEFPIFERSTYLNSCSLGALSAARAPGSTRISTSGTPAAPRPGTTPGGRRSTSCAPRYGRLVGAAAGLHRAASEHVERPRRGRRRPSTTAARPRVVVTSLDFPTIALPVAGQGAGRGRGRGAARVRTGSACRSRCTNARWTIAPRWWPPATSSSPAAPSRTRPRIAGDRAPRGRALPRRRLPGGGSAPGGRPRAGRGLLLRRRAQVAARRHRHRVPVRAARPAGGARAAR